MIWFVVPVWSTIADVKDTELRLAEVRADLLCELVAVNIIRFVLFSILELFCW